jgi:large subunit ribosomal protein L19e
VQFDPERLTDISEAITKSDLRGLIAEGAIKEKPVAGISRGRTRALSAKKARGQRKGHGKRKGKHTARLGRKEEWINKIRSQRKVLETLREKEKLEPKEFRGLYRKAKGGFFRSVRHIRLYIEEHGLMKK